MIPICNETRPSDVWGHLRKNGTKQKRIIANLTWLNLPFDRLSLRSEFQQKKDDLNALLDAYKKSFARQAHAWALLALNTGSDSAQAHAKEREGGLAGWKIMHLSRFHKRLALNLSESPVEQDAIFLEANSSRLFAILAKCTKPLVSNYHKNGSLSPTSPQTRWIRAADQQNPKYKIIERDPLRCHNLLLTTRSLQCLSYCATLFHIKGLDWMN